MVQVLPDTQAPLIGTEQGEVIGQRRLHLSRTKVQMHYQIVEAEDGTRYLPLLSSAAEQTSDRLFLVHVMRDTLSYGGPKDVAGPSFDDV